MIHDFIYSMGNCIHDGQDHLYKTRISSWHNQNWNPKTCNGFSSKWKIFKTFLIVPYAYEESHDLVDLPPSTWAKIYDTYMHICYFMLAIFILQMCVIMCQHLGIFFTPCKFFNCSHVFIIEILIHWGTICVLSWGSIYDYHHVILYTWKFTIFFKVFKKFH